MSRALFLATPLPTALADEGRAVVDGLRDDGPRRARADRAAEWILAVGAESLRYHLREPLSRLGVGMLSMKALNVALDLALRGLGGPTRSILGGMDEAQLRQVADEIEARLYPDPHG